MILVLPNAAVVSLDVLLWKSVLQVVPASVSAAAKMDVAKCLITVNIVWLLNHAEEK